MSWTVSDEFQAKAVEAIRKVAAVTEVVENMGDLDDPRFLHAQTLGLLLQIRDALAEEQA